MKLISIQLNEKTTRTVSQGHPWIFRNQISDYSDLLQNGDWVILTAKDKKILGYGIYSETGLIGIRVYIFGETFEGSEFLEKVKLAISKRKSLTKITSSLRLIHGENDRLPGITIDCHAQVLVVMVYSNSILPVARYIAGLVFRELKNDVGLKIKPDTIIFRIPKRIGEDTSSFSRILRGTVPEDLKIRYRNINYAIDISDQKGGIFNDIRNLREFILENKKIFKHKKCLNLFSHNGLLSRCLEDAGAAKIISMDSSANAIRIHSQNAIRSTSQEIIRTDIFKNLRDVLKERNELFDIIIIDPPNLTPDANSLPTAKQAYKRLFETAIPYLFDRGYLILCSCSNRLSENEFERIGRESIAEAGRKIKSITRLKEESDHPVILEFPEGKYFKAHIYELVK